MIPDAVFQRGISVMAGIRISDPEKMTEILKQGGSAYHLLRECCEKVAFVKETPQSHLEKIGTSLSNLEEGRYSKRTLVDVKDRGGSHQA
jgi:hypothetical protein